MNVICGIVLALSVCLCGAHLIPDYIDFLEFTVRHRKLYQSEDESDRRFVIWKENNELIGRHNVEESRGLHSYTMAMNQFGDLTHDEYRNEMLGYKPGHQQTGNTADLFTSGPLPEAVDWKAKGYVTEVGNQGQCGSCWAFTATGALEGQHKKKTGKLVDLSEQNLMDCSGKQGNQGCNGGWMDASFTYTKVNGGIDTESSYPYNSTNPGTGKCKYTVRNRGATCTGYVDLPKGNETALQIATADIGPIAVAVDASHVGFEFYKSGVYDDPTCSSENVDHTMVITGYGTEDGKLYWECKNSWGTTWGNKGYIRMVRNKGNRCGVATEASYPTV